MTTKTLAPKKRTKKALKTLTGGLSDPSKMPGKAYGIPAEECKLGAILRKKEGSTCHDCYAMKGNYTRYPAVKAAQRNRLALMLESPEEWESAMAESIERETETLPQDDQYFRWHDSGDIQDLDHLQRIVRIARALPSLPFWLPTRELGIVRAFLALGETIPSNLNIRLSAAMVGQPAPSLPGCTGSTVDNPQGYQCPAPEQGGECGDCRACWDPTVPSVNYHKH